jgi:tetratricopeptide (TPR) repeat protein
MSRAVVILALAAIFGFFTPSASADDRSTCETMWKTAPDEAIAACTRLIATRRGLAIAYRFRGLAYNYRGDFNLAVADLNEAIRLGVRYSAVYNDRGWAYAELGDYDLAIVDLNEAIRLDPKNFFAYGNRGWAFSSKGDYDRAIPDLTESIRLNPRSAPYYTRAVAYKGKGDYEHAIADFSEAIRLDPKNEDARAQRAALEETRAQAQVRTQPPAVVEAPAQPMNRVALVIGNSAYTSVAALPNARRDADAVAAALRKTNFQSVMVENDLPREKLVNVLVNFAAAAEKADWAMIYFAGHGIEVGGINYLIPVDARLASDRDVSLEAVSLDQLMNAVEGARKLRMVLLDACRENPFVSQMRRTAASRSISRGLGRIEPEAGTLVVYAAKHGEVASDGDGEHSPFASAFVKRLATPGLEVRRLFDYVRDDALAATQRHQQPFSYGSLPASEDFFFIERK